MATNTKILTELLEVLVAHWGLEAVSSCLQDVQRENELTPDKQSSGKSVSEGKKGKRGPNPVLAVRRLPVPQERKELLSKLAESYDDKRFLPSIGAVRHFFEMHGRSPNLPSDRLAAFRPLLKLLLELTDEDLRRILVSKSHWGPAELAPLSDAIGDAASSLRAREKRDKQS